MSTLSARTHFDFLGRRRLALGFSATLVVLSLIFLVMRGLNFGLDFTGGVIVQVHYDHAVELENVRGALNEAGYTQAIVQSFGTASDVLIRLPPAKADVIPDNQKSGGASNDNDATGDAGATAGASGGGVEQATDRIGADVLSALSADNPNVIIRQTQIIGPEVGKDLAQQASLALVITFLMVFIYVMVRFRWKFAAGAILGLIHDVVIVMGFFALFQWEFNLTVLAAVLAVIGYSLNDTIVVYDRIRENFKAIRRGSAIKIMNAAVNQTLSRTINTSVTTMLVLIVLLLLGGDSVGGFSKALIIGVVMGTYSSIYISAALALLFDVKPADMVPPKRDTEVDALP